MQSKEGLLHPRSAREPSSRPRRSRIPLSCDPCRQRKLKCNREKPCHNCTARKEEAGCQYRGPHPESASVAQQRTTVNDDAMRQRIDHLEDLVKRLVADKARSPDGMPTPDSTTSDASSVPGSGKTVMDGVHSVYLGGEDWSAVLEEIDELKKTWAEGQGDDDGNEQVDELCPTPSYLADGSSLLFTETRPIERMEILSSLPAKPEVDQLIAQFFDYPNFPINVPPIIHKPTFMREYQEHWQDPTQTNLVWLGLLFSILGITMLAAHQYGEPPPYEGLSKSRLQLYRMRTAQCLLSGDIAKCFPYTVEALRLNATAELNRKDDSRRGLWILTGVIVRAAVNMGYHRDPVPSSPRISALQAEYRRRVWLSIISMDDMASFLGGFPRTMSALFSDTLEPRNLHEWELGEATDVLPPSRPLSERTAVTYLIVKGRLCRALGAISDYHNNTSGRHSYQTVLDLDRALQDAYGSFPPYMKPAASALDAAVLSEHSRAEFSNLSLFSMYHKGLCTLHRRFLAKDRTAGHYAFSQQQCLSSSLAILAFQRVLPVSFYKLSETRHMLALAAMILLLELELRRKVPAVEETPDSSSLLRSLDESCVHWREAQDTCDEARKVYQLLSRMVAGFHAGEAGEYSKEPMETSLELPGLSLQPDGRDAAFSFADELDGTEFDWISWDTFMADAEMHS